MGARRGVYPPNRCVIGAARSGRRGHGGAGREILCGLFEHVDSSRCILPPGKHKCVGYKCVVKPTQCAACLDIPSRVSDETCSHCHHGYTLKDNACNKYHCKEELCKTCQPVFLRTDSDNCLTCKPGYKFVEADRTCTPYTCKKAASGAGCASCFGQPLRVSDETCNECNAGYYLIVRARTCVPYECETTQTGKACKTCVAQTSRKSHADCASCNSGYFLAGTTCIPFGCTTSNQGPGCKRCVYQQGRTAENHCSQCNAGYHLEGNVCKPYACDAQRCLSCAQPWDRTSAATCQDCHTSWVLNKVDKRCQRSSKSSTSSASFLEASLRREGEATSLLELGGQVPPLKNIFSGRRTCPQIPHVHRFSSSYMMV